MEQKEAIIPNVCNLASPTADLENSTYSEIANQFDIKTISQNQSSTSGSSDNSSEDSMECLSEGSIDEKSVEADKFASLTHWSDKVLREAARSHFQIFPLAEINDAIEAMVWWESALKSRNQRLDEENAEYGAKLHEIANEAIRRANHLEKQLSEQQSNQEKLEIQLKELKKLVSQTPIYKNEMNLVEINEELRLLDCTPFEGINMIEFDEFCAMLWTMPEVNQPSGTLFCGAFGAEANGIPKFIRRVLLQDIYPALYFRHLQQPSEFHLAKYWKLLEMEEVFSCDKILRNDSVESCHFTGAAFSHKNRRCSLRLNGVSYSISIQAKNRIAAACELLRFLDTLNLGLIRFKKMDFTRQKHEQTESNYHTATELFSIAIQLREDVASARLSGKKGRNFQSMLMKFNL